MTIYTKSVTSDVSKLFSLSDSDIDILRHYGKHGPTLRNSINLQNKSKRQVARQIDLLYQRGYLYLIKSKKYRSSNKFIKLYGLSLKGFIISLNDQNVDSNYYFKKFVSLFSGDLQLLVKKYIKLLISEFILYHKSIGLKIDSIYFMSKYIREIIYDYDLILNEADIDKLKKIHDDMIIVDKIRDLITDIEMYDDPSKEHIKIEFLINFWPYVIDEIGKGTDIERELENISDDLSPFGLSEYIEDFKKFSKEKNSMILKQWQLRKLDFTKAYSLSF